MLDSSPVYELTLSTLCTALQTGKITATKAVQSCLQRIDSTESQVKALLHVMAESAYAQAKELDATGPVAEKPLWGVPVILKDLFACKGTPTTCASKILKDFVPCYDATVVERLKNAGAIILAKANMDEFAMGSSTENSAFQTSCNPWNVECVAGGSSGGSAAAVAAMQCFAALGSDTGGSIRLPASFCGVVGLKPTYGRVSRYGMVAFGSSLDQIGPMGRSVEDVARVLTVIAGHDERDSTSVNVPVPDYLASLGREDLSGLTIGLPQEYWGHGLDAEVEEVCRQAISTMESLGAKTVPVTLSMTEYAVATYYIVAMAEASSNLARFDGVRYGHRCKEAKELVDMYVRSRTEGFGDEVQRRILIGTYVLSAGYYDAYYGKAAQIRRLIRQDFDKAFAHCDLIAGPVCPQTAFKLGAVADPLQMYLQDIFTISLNLAGLPGMSLPVGLGANSGMPVGLQLMGPAFGEECMLSVADLMERTLPALGSANLC